MKRVPVDTLLPGMILARPVTNASGLPIVPAGCELTGPIIDRLRQLNLTSVSVQGDADDGNGKTLAELHEELDHRFRSVRHDPVQERIARQIRNHLEATRGVPRGEESGPQ